MRTVSRRSITLPRAATTRWSCISSSTARTSWPWHVPGRRPSTWRTAQSSARNRSPRRSSCSRAWAPRTITAARRVNSVLTFRHFSSTGSSNRCLDGNRRGCGMNRIWFGLVFLAAAGTAPSSAQLPPESRGPRILVGPTILVSREPTVPHVEPWVAAHPSDPSKLIAMATTYRDTDGIWRAAFYSSDDGGYSWSGPTRPHLPQYTGQDPIVGYGLNGTAYAVSLTSGPGGSAMWVYRSSDNGLTWDAGFKIRQADHERLAVDFGGKYAGRAYLAAEGLEAPTPTNPNPRRRPAFVYRSLDDGKTWLGPVVAAVDPDARTNVAALQVLSDGTVAVFMQRPPPPGADPRPTRPILFATSSDGGATFSNAREIGQLDYGGRDEVARRMAAGRFDADATTSFEAAVDTHSQRFRDRMYIVHAERRTGAAGNRVVVSHSTDRGITWSAPKEIAPEADPEAGQFHSAIAVNQEGTVGVFWYDTRGLVGRDQWHVYFSASLDGG